MKILIVRPYPSFICIDKYNVQEIGLAKALIKKGHQCDIVFFTDIESYEEDYVINELEKIHIFWKKGKKILCQGIYDFKELIELTNNYDAVQTNEYNQIASYIICKWTKARFLIYHGPYKNKKDIKGNIAQKIFDLFFLSNMKKMNIKILTKSILAEEFLRKKGFKNIKTVGVGLDIQRLEKNLIQKKEIKTLLYIGEISKRRNTLFLLRVLREIKKTEENIQLIIIGKGKASYEKKCRKFINKNKLEKNICYIREVTQKDIAQYYLMSDIFVFPSNYEIFGMVLLEAMYFELPIISSENGGANTLISNKKNGIIINKFDVKEWSKEIIYQLKTNEIKDSYYINNTFDKIQNNFTWDYIAKKFIDSYLEF